jgi:site-specific recombinase XerC
VTWIIDAVPRRALAAHSGGKVHVTNTAQNRRCPDCRRGSAAADHSSGASVRRSVYWSGCGHHSSRVKQQLAAVRMLFDWLVIGQVVPMNPAAAVRGPKHVVKTGKTPVLDAGEWRKLIDSIPTETVRDLRDRALIATLTYSFARIMAALRMKVEDLRPQGAGWRIQLHEKGGKEHAMPCHHALAEALRAYIDAAGIAEDRKGWLFRTSPRPGCPQIGCTALSHRSACALHQQPRGTRWSDDETAAEDLRWLRVRPRRS